MASSRAGARRDEGLQAEIAVRTAPRQVAGQLGDDAAIARGEPEGGVAVQDEPVAAGHGRRGGVGSGSPWSRRASRSRVSCLASSTFGWSNGSMPRTAPAMAVATSQRTNSAPTSIGSDRSIRMTGWPAASRASARRSRAASSSVVAAPARLIRTNARSGPYASTAPSGSRSTGTIPTPCLPVLSAISCSTHAPNDEMASSVRKVSLSRPASASVPMARPERHAGIVRRVRLAAGAQHRRRGCQQRVEVEPDQRRRHQPDVGQRRVPAADVGRVEEHLAEVVVVGDRLDAAARIADRRDEPAGLLVGVVAADVERGAGHAPRPRPGTRSARSWCPTSRRPGRASGADRDRRRSRRRRPGRSNRGCAARGSPPATRRSDGARPAPGCSRPCRRRPPSCSPGRRPRRRSLRGPRSGSRNEPAHRASRAARRSPRRPAGRSTRASRRGRTGGWPTPRFGRAGRPPRTPRCPRRGRVAGR